MRQYDLVRKIQMECPMCDKIHEVEERKRVTHTIIKGEEVAYEETYYFCQYSDEDESEFASGKMENANLLNALNAYRKKHDLLTSHEIVAIRERYGLSQADLAKLLDWGEATISRYESKAIQDAAYDNMLRIVRDDPLKFYEFLQKNGDRLPSSKRLVIKEKIIDSLDAYGRAYLKRQALESEYLHFQEPSDANGNQILSIDKIESAISYLAERIEDLYKVKLMKLLWYADSLCFKLTGRAITGLVYLHGDMGALPLGHYRIIGLENVNIREEEGYEFTKYHFLPNPRQSMACLTKEEKDVLGQVAAKFKSYSAQSMVRYMHEEKAYLETEDGEVIPFSLAKDLRAF
ncbi:MAG: DUF4065 domain-containing protein [Firmicutes bacterium]|jgi:putative zinc finger/helix-turn-helix YgiT family protein|nr:DUF4065 domain-containing protein [Bacillota bacterium]